MAIAEVVHTDVVEAPRTLRIARLLVAGGVTGGLFFVLCWAGQFLPFGSPTHAYIGLFTNAEMTSGRALVEGGVWVLLFGGLISGLFGLVYNATKAFGRR